MPKLLTNAGCWVSPGFLPRLRATKIGVTWTLSSPILNGGWIREGILQNDVFFHLVFGVILSDAALYILIESIYCICPCFIVLHYVSRQSPNTERESLHAHFRHADRCLTHMIYINSCSSATYEVTSWTKRMEKTTSTINKTWQQHVVPNSIPRREKSNAACLHAGTCYRFKKSHHVSWKTMAHEYLYIYASICKICYIILYYRRWMWVRACISR